VENQEVKIVFLLMLFIFFVSFLRGQSTFLQQKIRFSPTQIQGSAIEDHLRWLENEKKITVAYTSVAFDDQKEVKIKEGVYSIDDFLYLLLAGFDVQLTFVPPAKILIIPAKGTKSEVFYQVSGYVKDILSNEVLVGAVVEIKSGSFYSISNSSGYYSLKLPPGVHEIEVNYLGYKILRKNFEVFGPTILNIFMEFQNELPALTISRERINYWNFGDQVEVFKTKEFKSLLGESDPMNNVRVIPGIQSGGEGQSGLFVRGGGADQNLVLLEGVPLYEASHTVGIASLFIEESVKEASLIKNGFPARYGGRLSSVMDVHLKDGNTSEHERVISIGIPGVKFHANGPIWKNKTTYNFSARTSWINYYVNKFLLKFTNYDEIRIDYRDLMGKITHRFSENHKITFSAYTGGDRLALSKTFQLDSANYQFSSVDKNRLQWSNSLASIQWYYTPFAKWSFQAGLGYLSYKHRARSSYVFETTLFENRRTDELDIFSFADIRSANVKFLADYFLNERHTLKMGVEYNNHVFNPVVKQSTILLEGEAENILDKDSLIRAGEYSAFIEDHFRIHKNLVLYAGLHANVFKPVDTSYFSLQPRFNIVWKPFKNFITSAAVTRMRQNIRLLVNLGLGLPSDLWVPSTKKVNPQDAWQFSLSQSYAMDDFHFLQVGAYYKNMTGLLEFQSPVDLFYFFINETEVVPVYNNSRDWERNVFTGSGSARGVEFLFHRKNKRTNGWLSVTWSRSFRSFPEIDNGKPFPFKYDRTWDVNSGLSFRLNQNWSFGANFVYGTGQAFSLSTEEFTTILGTSIINTASRNNRRLPDFHQLSANINYSRPFLKDGKWNIHFNIYNVYNRLNAYFIYIYKNPLTKEYLAKKVSILPITPSLYFSLTF
jgi:hypothetical protein